VRSLRRSLAEACGRKPFRARVRDGAELVAQETAAEPEPCDRGKTAAAQEMPGSEIRRLRSPSLPPKEPAAEAALKHRSKLAGRDAAVVDRDAEFDL